MDGDLVLRHQRFLKRLVAGLVRDEHAAEDLVQATWLRALERPPRAASVPRAWLARVARNLARNRARDERPEREIAAELQDERAWPSADEVAERLELAARVVAAVHELPPQLSAVVLARYDEELPLEEIARRSGAPLDTIKDRLKRAREELRRRLGRELGEEHDPRPALVALARGMGTWLVEALLVKKWIALALGIVLVVVGVRALQRRSSAEDSAPAVPATELAATAPLAAEEPLPIEEAARAPVASVPERLATTAAPEGALAITVAWPDGSAAEGVSARVWPDEDGELVRTLRTGTTDASGRIALAGLVPGTWRVQLDRQKAIERAEVRAGETTELALAVSGNTRLEGLVVDPDDIPIAGAAVWISPRQPSWNQEPLDDWVAARTGSDGRFAIRALGDAWIVGARAEGYAPAPHKAIRWMREVEEVRLVLAGPGGTIEGRVVEPDGTPVAGAVVSGDVGFRSDDTFDADGNLTGRVILNSLPVRQRTASDGTFRLAGVQPGTVELSADSVEMGRSSRDVRVDAGAVARIELVLERRGSIAGRVLTPDGSPLSGTFVFARVTGSDAPVSEDAEWLSQDWSRLAAAFPDRFVTTRSRGDGSYRLSGIEPGWNFVGAERGDAGRALEPLVVELGVEARVELALDRGVELRCIVLDAGGAPLPDLPVYVARETGSGGTMGSRGPFSTDAEGRLVVPDCRVGSYQVDVRRRDGGMRYRGGTFRGLNPGAVEHRLVVEHEELATTRVTGLVLDDAGRPLAGARVDRVRPEGGSARIATTGTDGRFRSDGFEAGTYRFWIRHPDLPYLELPAREIPGGATLDLGTVQLVTPGFLDVALRRANHARIDGERMHVALHDADGRYVFTRFQVELGHAVYDPVTPGEYELRVTGDGVAARRTVRVVAGVTTELELVLEPVE